MFHGRFLKCADFFSFGTPIAAYLYPFVFSSTKCQGREVAFTSSDIAAMYATERNPIPASKVWCPPLCFSRLLCVLFFVLIVMWEMMSGKSIPWMISVLDGWYIYGEEHILQWSGVCVCTDYLAAHEGLPPSSIHMLLICESFCVLTFIGSFHTCI